VPEGALVAKKKDRPPPPKKPKELEAMVRSLLAQPLPDETLRQELEALASQRAFYGLAYLWGPELYRRNRVLFRPFILNHFATLLQLNDWDWQPVAWKDHAAALEPWLEEVDRRDDVELFHRLYPWKLTKRGWGGMNVKNWRSDLLARFQAAADPAQRNLVLTKFDVPGVTLDEATALALYRLDPAMARPFLLKHPPQQNSWGQARKLPEQLCTAARQQGDEELYFTLYRQMVPQKVWEKDVEDLAREVEEPQRLLEELEKRHPAQSWGLDVGKGLYTLAEKRGRDVISYLMKHLDSIWSYGLFGGGKKNKLLDLARSRGWWDMWSVLVRKGDNDQYNREVLALVEDRSQPDEVIFRRLVMLSGAAGEWNWGRFAWQQIPALKDKTAVALYGRFPELVHGPFRKHLVVSWWGGGELPKLTAAALAKDDHLLIDYLASQAVLIGHHVYYASQDKGGQKLIDQLLKYYEAKRTDPTAFARRVAAVLGQIPANAIGRGYRRLLQKNALARLFFEESSAALLHDPRTLRDLLEAAEIQVQLLALRVLQQDDDRARQLAADNLDLLQATLLRRMYRSSRLVALAALANAVTPANAPAILRRARQALDLPDKGYPKEQLLSLLADVYRRCPELRGGREQPVVYRGRTKERPWATSGRKRT
jgi:hypothetical protein